LTIWTPASYNSAAT